MRRFRLAPPLFALALLAVAGAAPASAAPVTLSMGGTLTQVALNGGPAPSEFASIAAGDAWSLAFTFDGETQDDTPDDLTSGVYQGGEFITSYELTIGASTVTYSLSGTSTILGTGQVSSTPSFGYIAGTQNWSFSLQSGDPFALASDDLPVAWPSLSVFDLDRTFRLNLTPPFGVNNGFTVGDIEWLGAPSTTVPEPAAIGLSLVAALALAVRRSRRA